MRAEGANSGLERLFAETQDGLEGQRERRNARLVIHDRPPSRSIGSAWLTRIGILPPLSPLSAKLPPDSLPPTNTRRKDRMSYSHQAFKIDLTQVTTSPDPAHAQVSHELEIEFADANELMRCGRVRTKGSSGATWSGKEGEAFDELIRVFVNNIRILVRNAG